MTGTEIFRIERARGASIGATIVGGFGAIWLAMAMVSTGVPTKVALTLVLPVSLLIAFLGWMARRRVPQQPGEASPEKKRKMRAFAMVNVVQWLAIFGTANLLRNLHLGAWIVPSIVLIVGAHFLPLARLFQTRSHLVTGTAMMLCAAAAIVLPVSIRDTAECIGAGLILWADAANALRVAFRIARGMALTPQATV